METMVGVDEEKRERMREEGEGLGLGFGFGSAAAPPQKLIRLDSFPFRMVVAPAASNTTSSHNNSSSSNGPTFFYNGNCDLYDAGRNLQPFPASFGSPGVGVGVGSGGGAGLRGFPFTTAQWQELQRQALIYKHIMASVPVPPELLFPISPRSFPDAASHHFPPNLVGRGGTCFNLRFSNSTDPEPGRCRRTDGKKWRCSRDVAPDQKYCERHVHRGRPRSRKPVELHKPKPTTPTPISTTTTTTTTSTLTTAVTTNPSTTTLSTAFSPQSCRFFPKHDLKPPFQSMEPFKESRFMDWTKGDTEEMTANQQWEMLHSKIGLRNTNPVLQHYEEQLNLNYTDLNDQCFPFLNPDLSPLEEDTVANERDTPRRFIDAWSSEIPSTTTSTKSSVSSGGGKLPLSTLTLSMSGIEEDPDQIQMGLGISDPAVKSQPLNWMSSPLGGPLAEVLHSSNVTSPHHGCSKSSSGGLINLMNRSCCGSEEVSPQASPTRLVSSPTGVLQKTLVSLSDSSSSSSPTFGPVSRSETALQWMNQSREM